MVLLSPEDVTINGITLSTLFNEERGFFIVNEVTGRHDFLKSLQMTNALGQHGSYLLGARFEPRPMRIFFTMKGNDFPDLRKRMDRLNEIIYSQDQLELKFADEPNMTYLATVEGLSEIREKNSIHQGSIDLIRTTPFKYGAIQTQNFSNGAAMVRNNGSYEAFPIFTLYPTQDVTFLDILAENNYMRIGRPLESGEEATQREILTFYDEAETVVGWQASATIEQGTVMGAITSNTYTFTASNFGTGNGWHGPAIQRAIPNAPINDFVVEVGMRMDNPTTKHLGRILIELLDTNNKVISRFTLHKQAEGKQGNSASIYAGNTTNNDVVLRTSGPNENEYNNFHGVMRIAKRGNVWSGYIAQTDERTQEHYNRASNKFIDTENNYNQPLAQIRLHFGIYGQDTPAPMYIRYIKVWNVIDSTQLGPDIIAGNGDEIIIDHERNLILVNGEPRIDLKDFGADYFTLKKGLQTILLEPSNAFEGSLTFRERFI